MKRRTLLCGFLLLGVVVAEFVGCAREISVPVPNRAPDTFITSSEPRDSSRVDHHVELLWRGGDIDGTVVYYEYILHTYLRTVARIDQVMLQQPAAADPRWTRVDAARISLAVLADTLRADPRGDIGSGEFDRWHTFYVRSVDNEGAADLTPGFRTFQAYTVAPRIGLQAPATAGMKTTVPRTFVMNWSGVDSIGGVEDPQDPKETRWLLREVTLDASDNPMGYPDSLYEFGDEDWGPWRPWAEPDSSGREAVFADLVPMGSGPLSYVFAIQGRDDGGAVTPQFDSETPQANNYTVLTVDGSLPVGPRLNVYVFEDSAFSRTFDGSDALPTSATVGVDTLSLFWDAPQTRHYGANPDECRYGWNLVDPSGDDEWTDWSFRLFTEPHVLTMSEEVFYLQCRDHLMQTTTGVITFQRTTP